jgi:tRNA modification GTPase
MNYNDTIVALATPSGVGAIGVIRVSGNNAISISNNLFKPLNNKSLLDQSTHTIHLGHIYDGDRALDEVLLSIFKDPKSYTGENVVEVSCHGSHYIQSEIIQLFIRNGCRAANPGEFTLRAFLNGKMDLSQAEAVADLIASDSESSHKIALQQMRGGFSNKIKELRDELIDFASLIELELDFSGEDVDFADLEKFESLLNRISDVLKYLIDSFSTGNVIKSGVPISIVGEPNVGKSTLLNLLLDDEKAIVSDIAGTTRDAIEDELIIDGIKFRFIDTAGIRKTDNLVESIGIKKTFKKMKDSRVILYMVDCGKLKKNHVTNLITEIKKIINNYSEKHFIIVFNKIELINNVEIINLFKDFDSVSISAKTGHGLDDLKNKLSSLLHLGKLNNNDIVITNARHYDALMRASQSINNVKKGLKSGLTGDLLSIDIRESIHHFGRITGEISTDDLLGNIFSNFCIGK